MLLIQERGHKNICSCFITLTGKFHHFRVFFDFFLKKMPKMEYNAAFFFSTIRHGSRYFVKICIRN